MNNIITASFGASKRVVTRSAWMEDKGMILRFVGIDLPPVYEVHFSRSRTEAAKIVLGDENGVQIPSEYFKGVDRIYAWFYLTPADGVGYTEYEVQIPLIRRPTTTNVQPTPEEESIIDQAISALNNAVETSTNAAETAVEAAESVSETAYKMNTFESTLYGEIFGASSAVTERVEEGTWLKNQLWCNKILAIVGYCIDSGTLRLFGILGTHEPDGGTQITYQLRNPDSADDPYELTLENAPEVREMASRTAYYKVRFTVDGFTHHIDHRLCRVRLDADGNEIERLYSSQYRYTVEGGVVSRARFKTAEQDASLITDLGLIAPTASISVTYNTPKKTANQYTLLPLVSTVQTSSYKFIIPDSFFTTEYGLSVVALGGDYREYVGPTFDKAKEDRTKSLEADFNGEIFFGVAAQTQRVNGGTLLLNPMRVTKLCAQVGYVWEEARSKLHVYFVFSSPTSVGRMGSVETYILYEKDSESEPYELTLENTETRITPSGEESNNYKWHLDFDDVESHIDVRGLRIMFDADGNEIDRIYSAQYRYEIDGGVVAQTPLQTPIGDAAHIIALGLLRITTSVGRTFSYKTYNSGGLLIPTGLYPLVSTVQSSKFNYIIPDSFFEGATYGLAFCTVAGDGARFLGPTFDKAPAIPQIPELPSSDGTYTLRLVMSDGVPTLTWIS